MTTIYDFPAAWYDWGLAVPGKYRLRSMSQVANRPWQGAVSIKGPHAQLWMVDMTTAPLQDPNRQDAEAFFSRLRGRAGLLRFADPTKLDCWYNRNTAPASSRFSDGTLFSDGTGFVDGLMPPTVYVAQVAAKGSRYLVLKGFPASVASALRRGDPLEIKPNGVPAGFPHSYHAMIGGDTDASGQIGIQIEPPLRAGVSVGDTVSLRTAASVFRLTTDDSGEMEFAAGFMGSISFSLVEALDLVP